MFFYFSWREKNYTNQRIFGIDFTLGMKFYGIAILGMHLTEKVSKIYSSFLQRLEIFRVGTITVYAQFSILSDNPGASS